MQVGMYMLTDNLNLNVKILAKVETATVNILADLDFNVKTLIQSTEFWHAKIEYDFGEDVLRFKPRDVAIQEFYASYTNIQRHGAHFELLIAAEKGDLITVKIALNTGVNANIHDAHQNTPIMWSSWQGNKEIVQELIRHGADVNAQNILGNTALMMSAEAGHMQIVQELLAAGANPKIRDQYLDDAAQYATRNSRAKIVELLRA